MGYSFTNNRWSRIIGIAIAIVAISFLIVLVITTAYAFKLAFVVRGKPDQVAIGHFSASISRWMMPLLEAFLTFFCSLFILKKSEKNVAINGLFLGIAVSLLGLAMKLGFGGQSDIYTFLNFLAITAIGYIGGLLNQKRIDKKLKSPT